MPACFISSSSLRLALFRPSLSFARAITSNTRLTVPTARVMKTSASVTAPPLSNAVSSDRSRDRLERGQLAAVGNAIAVALLGQEQLPVVREVQLARVARHQREEMGGLAARLGPQDAPEPLRFLLARAERARHLDQHAGV